MASSAMPVLHKTPIQQLIALEALPLTTNVTIKRGRVRWQGQLQPTPLSESYTLRIDYTLHGPPEVTVRSPELHIPKGANLPHVFPGRRLCLYYPCQWNRSMLIAHTLVPWASEWLLHYELWTFTGVWHGGGHEPDSDRD